MSSSAGSLGASDSGAASVEPQSSPLLVGGERRRTGALPRVRSHALFLDGEDESASAEGIIVPKQINLTDGSPDLLYDTGCHALQGTSSRMEDRVLVSDLSTHPHFAGCRRAVLVAVLDGHAGSGAVSHLETHLAHHLLEEVARQVSLPSARTGTPTPQPHPGSQPRELPREQAFTAVATSTAAAPATGTSGTSEIGAVPEAAVAAPPTAAAAGPKGANGGHEHGQCFAFARASNGNGNHAADSGSGGTVGTAPGSGDAQPSGRPDDPPVTTAAHFLRPPRPPPPGPPDAPEPLQPQLPGEAPAASAASLGLPGDRIGDNVSASGLIGVSERTGAQSAAPQRPAVEMGRRAPTMTVTMGLAVQTSDPTGPDDWGALAGEEGGWDVWQQEGEEQGEGEEPWAPPQEHSAAAERRRSSLALYDSGAGCQPPDPPGALRNALLRCERELMDLNCHSGTTALVALMLGSSLWLANVGDCRAVVCDDGEARQLTVDHKAGSGRPDAPEAVCGAAVVERQRLLALGVQLSSDGYLQVTAPDGSCSDIAVSRNLGCAHLKDRSTSGRGSSWSMPHHRPSRVERLSASGGGSRPASAGDVGAAPASNSSSVADAEGLRQLHASAPGSMAGGVDGLVSLRARQPWNQQHHQHQQESHCQGNGHGLHPPWHVHHHPHHNHRRSHIHHHNQQRHSYQEASGERFSPSFATTSDTSTLTQSPLHSNRGTPHHHPGASGSTVTFHLPDPAQAGAGGAGPSHHLHAHHQPQHHAHQHQPAMHVLGQVGEDPQQQQQALPAGYGQVPEQQPNLEDQNNQQTGSEQAATRLEVPPPPPGLARITTSSGGNNARPPPPPLQAGLSPRPPRPPSAGGSGSAAGLHGSPRPHLPPPSPPSLQGRSPADSSSCTTWREDPDFTGATTAASTATAAGPRGTAQWRPPALVSTCDNGPGAGPPGSGACSGLPPLPPSPSLLGQGPPASGRQAAVVAAAAHYHRRSGSSGGHARDRSLSPASPFPRGGSRLSSLAEGASSMEAGANLTGSEEEGAAAAAAANAGVIEGDDPGANDGRRAPSGAAGSSVEERGEADDGGDRGRSCIALRPCMTFSSWTMRSAFIHSSSAELAVDEGAVPAGVLGAGAAAAAAAASVGGGVGGTLCPVGSGPGVGSSGAGAAAGALIPDPDLFHYQISQDSEFLICACDGLWDVMRNGEACRMVRRWLADGRSATNAAEALCQTALKLGSPDNISVIVVRFSGRPLTLAPSRSMLRRVVSEALL